MANPPERSIFCGKRIVIKEDPSFTAEFRAALAREPIQIPELYKHVEKMKFLGLTYSAKFLAELIPSFCCNDATEDEDYYENTLFNEVIGDLFEGIEEHQDLMWEIKTYFDQRQFLRVSTTLQTNIEDIEKSQTAFFMYMYSDFLQCEKIEQEEFIGHLEKKEVREKPAKDGEKRVDRRIFHTQQTDALNSIAQKLGILWQENKLDPLLLFLFGIVLLKQNKIDFAKEILVISLNEYPYNYSAWQALLKCQMLLNLGDSKAKYVEREYERKIFDMCAPNHWMSYLFEILYLVARQEHRLALPKLISIRSVFDIPLFLCLKAICHYNLRDFDTAMEDFQKLREIDPKRLNSLDIYSNIMYIRKMTRELSKLARDVMEIDRNSAECHVIVGNYYSLKQESTTALVYFQLAGLINPRFTTGWILAGHELMELKQYARALVAYHTALFYSPCDYRCFYAIGQAHILQNNIENAIYYFRKTILLRRNDPQIWMSLAQAHEGAGNLAEALNSYLYAFKLNETTGVALPKLCLIYNSLNDRNTAAAYYRLMVESLLDIQFLPTGGLPWRQRPQMMYTDECTPFLHCLYAEQQYRSLLIPALRYLLTYFRDEGSLLDAETCAKQLLDFDPKNQKEYTSFLSEKKRPTELRDPQKKKPVGMMK